MRSSPPPGLFGGHLAIIEPVICNLVNIGFTLCSQLHLPWFGSVCVQHGGHQGCF